MSNNLYPKEHEALLQKAGLIGTGYMEVRGIHKIKEVTVSEDGITFEKVARPEISDLITGSTSLVKTRNGQIAGYWANGLTKEEVEIINKECNVPLYHLDEPVNPLTNKPYHADSRITIVEGRIFNLEVPSDVAIVKLLMELPFTIGLNKQEAKDNGAMLYFHSVEEEQQNKLEEINSRREVAKLVESATRPRKHQLVKILAALGELNVDSSINEDNAVLVFNETCFTNHAIVAKAVKVTNPNEFIAVHTLIRAGHIEAASNNGPYYKAPILYGTRSLIADSFEDLVAHIHGFPDLIKAFKELESHERNASNPIEDKPVSAGVMDFMAKHGLVKKVASKEASEEDNLRNKIKGYNTSKMLKLLADEGIEHSLTSDDDVKDIKDFYIDSMLKTMG